MEEQDVPFKEESPNTFWDFLSYIGQGFVILCIGLTIVIVYRGCSDKPSLLPSIIATEAQK
jgi:hypothetical protein